MEGQRFDDLTRALTAGASRRRALRLLVGGMTAALGAALGRDRAGAQPPTCAAYGRVCSGTGCCTTTGAACRCYANGHCRCVCPEGQAQIDGACACLGGGNPCPGGLGAVNGCCPRGNPACQNIGGSLVCGD